MSQQITVTRALAQVKALNDRINRATSQAFVTTTTGGKHESGKAVQEVEVALKSNLQSVVDLIAQRAALKGAIVRSNATTQVVIADVKMTVAEAIERKTSILLDKTLLAHLNSQLTQNQSKAERANVLNQARLDQQIQTLLGKDRKLDDSEVSSLTELFNKQNRSEVVDPNDLSKVIEKLTSDINAFDEEVDYALSEINAVTKITV